MCGQWGPEGYILNRKIDTGSRMKMADWKRLVDEAARHKIKSILVRGGEPFLFQGIIELLEYINRHGIYVSIDTNGTILDRFADDLIRIGNMHMTFSVDGPEEIHDAVRGVKGSFNKTKENIALLNELEKESGIKISKSICFTISRYNYKYLGEMPDVARTMSISSMNIVPYYYFSDDLGKKYEEELNENFNCPAFSWRGFHHDDSGVDFNIFRNEYRKYLANLDGVNNFQYMPFTEDEYGVWFSDPVIPVGSSTCMNIEKLIDIQPNGNANFCVDFPDYSIGDIKNSTIDEIWNGPKASRFRNYRRKELLSICHRCGARYMSEIKG